MRKLPNYREALEYRMLEMLCERAGVRVNYCTVSDGQIDGALWARSSDQAMVIEMPDADVFENGAQAALILGHELAHIVAAVDSSDEPAVSVINEALCDLLGGYFYKLAELMAGKEAEAVFRT
jgi:Zn-dependent peptidase ImmA (M78 family)